MNIAASTIKRKKFSLVLTFIMIVAGFYAYQKLGRLEDPEFAIKEALVITQYPGATPKEVEKEVTEVMETAVQELGQLDKVTSMSRTGASTLTVEIKDKYDKNALPQVWDELRRKVNDAQKKLPPNVLPSIVNDDYGDVYGVFLAISGDGYTLKELDDISDFLKRELLLVKDVAKATVWGLQKEQIYVEVSRARLAQLGINLKTIYELLAKQNFVADAGSVRVGDDYIRINPTGEFHSVEKIGNLLIKSEKTDNLFYLKDIASIKRDYISPPQKHLRYNMKNAVALGISTVSGGNVVDMGAAIKKKIAELSGQIPAGINIDYIYYQAEEVSKSINDFVINLIESLAIVIIILMIFMGLQSGILIGLVLLLTILATFVCMWIWHIDLQRISLGALIIALGMLVDNAIVVTEGMLIRIQQGMKKITAAKEVVAQTIWPLFGATIIAILSFAAIGLSQDSTGEYTRSLFQVLLISLGLSWVLAITITPLFCCLFMKGVKEGTPPQETYKGFLFNGYRSVLKGALHYRKSTLTLIVGLLIISVISFKYVERSFFPDSTSPQFLVHLWLPEGTDIRKTSEEMKHLEQHMIKQPGVKAISAFVGGGAPRYMLVYSPEKEYSSYGMLLVRVKDYKHINDLMFQTELWIRENIIESNPKLEKIRLGPGGGFTIEARFSGPDANTLRNLSNQAQKIMQANANTKGVRDDWHERVELIRPIYSEAKGSRLGITRTEVAEALKTTFTGKQVGLYREGKDLIPIVSRAPLVERESIDSMQDIQLWSNTANQSIPLRQVVDGFTTGWEDPIIHRRDKMTTITAQCDPIKGNASVLLNQLKPLIEKIPLPIGYNLEWGGEYENSNDAQAALSKNIPITLLIMILITVGLFNALLQPLIIWLTVPLAIIGVNFGLLVSHQTFGFMAILGFLSLTGMLIKNTIVLLDEIDLQMKSERKPFDSLVEASVSRLRPVCMAAFTTILGMLPLVQDVFFIGMAVTIMFGLLFATVLTMVIVPVFYATFFKIKETA